MSAQRKISTILFADIAGYTALMQENEADGLALLERFRAELERATPIHNGQIVQYFGDGALLAFDESMDAILCAKEMQAAFLGDLDVPVRMGIHTGEVIFRDNNAFGDVVNVASRVESLGVAGSVLISKSVHEAIGVDGQNSWKSLGSFDFKHVKNTIEVLAVADKGFAIPRRESMLGKLKQKAPVNRWRRALLLFGVYMLASWGLVQALAFGLYSFKISPHWADLLQWTLWGIIPSLLIYFVHMERLNRFSLHWREKIVFPLNVLALGAIMYVAFSGTDFGATTTQVNFAGVGNFGSQTILKEEYRTPIPVFSFSPKQQNKEDEWVGSAIKIMLLHDLHQDKQVSPTDAGNADWTMLEKIESTKVFHDRYIDGEFDIKDDIYYITPGVHSSKNGQQLASQSFQGADLLNVLDSVSVYVREAMGVKIDPKYGSVDLPLEAFMSDSPEAIRLYIEGVTMGSRLKLEESLAVDSSFTLAWMHLGKINLRWNKGRREAQYDFDQAYRYRSRLPSDKQLETMIYRHIAYKQYEEAEKLIKIQLEIEPLNQEFNIILNRIYGETRQFEAMLEHIKKLFAKQQNETNGEMYANALHVNGKAEQFLRLLKPFVALDPKNPALLTYLWQGQLSAGDYEAAIETRERVVLLEPDRKPVLAVSEEVIDFQKSEASLTEADKKAFTGKYYAHFDEGFMDITLFEGRIVQYFSNQSTQILMPANPARLVDGNLWKVWEYDFVKNTRGEFDRVRVIQTGESRKDTSWMWKFGPLVLEANALFEEGNLASAKERYIKALDLYPDHFYINLALSHITYAQGKSEEALQAQYQRVCGDYGIRRVWLEDGKLFLKRDGAARVMLLPISESRYISFSSIGVVVEFELKNNQSQGYQIQVYEPDLGKWRNLNKLIPKE